MKTFASPMLFLSVMLLLIFSSNAYADANKKIKILAIELQKHQETRVIDLNKPTEVPVLQIKEVLEPKEFRVIDFDKPTEVSVLKIGQVLEPKDIILIGNGSVTYQGCIGEEETVDFSNVFQTTDLIPVRNLCKSTSSLSSKKFKDKDGVIWINFDSSLPFSSSSEALYGECWARVININIRPSEDKFPWRQVICEANSTPEVISRIQTALSNQGVYTGIIDGVLDQELFRAMNEYQKLNGLATGGLTLESLESLGVDWRQ